MRKMLVANLPIVNLWNRNMSITPTWAKAKPKSYSLCTINDLIPNIFIENRGAQILFHCLVRGYVKYKGLNRLKIQKTHC
jgi:hypothetical protein